METAELCRLINSRLRDTKEQTDFILDADTAELDIVHPYDMIDNKKLKVAACKIIRKRLAEIYAITEKIEDYEKFNLRTLENLIDESML